MVGIGTTQIINVQCHQGMIDEFANAIKANRPPSVTGYDGYKALEIALAAYRSAESGQPVALPLA